LGILLFAAAAMSRRNIVCSLKPTIARRRSESTTTSTTHGSGVVRSRGEPEASYGDTETSVVLTESSLWDGIFHNWDRSYSRPNRPSMYTAIIPNVVIWVSRVAISSMGRRHRVATLVVLRRDLVHWSSVEREREGKRRTAGEERFKDSHWFGSELYIQSQEPGS